MSNLTISIDDEILRKARLRAMQQGTSVNAVLRELLEAYAGVPNQQARAAAELLELSNAVQSRRGNARWSRDELHERK